LAHCRLKPINPSPKSRSFRAYRIEAFVRLLERSGASYSRAPLAGNEGLLARHQIKPRELEVLSQVNLLGKVTAPGQFVFILNAIRQAVEEEPPLG
jgi:hypothetical protein